MASLYLSSHDTKATAHEVTERGYRTRVGNAWDADGVRRVLRNEALRGTFVWAFPGATILGEEFTAQTFTYEADPVLDAQTFDQVQRLLALSDRGKYRSGRTRYPLTGHIYGACGRRMNGVTFRDRHGNDEPRRYRCDAQDKDVCSCRKKSILADKVEDAVATWITVNLLRPDVVASLLSEHRALKADAVAAEKTVTQLRKRLASLESKQGDVFVMFAGADAKRILKRLNSEIEDVRAKIQTYSEAAASVAFTESDLADAIERVVGTATQSAQHRSHDELRRLVRMLDVRIDLRRGRMGAPSMSPATSPYQN